MRRPCWLLAVPASAYSVGLVGRNDTLAMAAASRSGTAAAFIKPDGSLWLWGHSASKTDWGMDTNDLLVPARFPGAAAKLPSVSAAGSGR